MVTTQNQAQRADERGGGRFLARVTSKQSPGYRLCATRADGTARAVFDSPGKSRIGGRLVPLGVGF